MPVKHRLFMMLAVVLLLACVMTISLWVWSYWQLSFIDKRTIDDDYNVWVNRGTVAFQRTTYALSGSDQAGWDYGYSDPDLPRSSAVVLPEPGLLHDMGFAGFHLYISLGGSLSLPVGPSGGISGVTSPPRFRVEMPLWFATLVFAILPAAAAQQIYRRRHRQGHCSRCGYDLRATPDRCPECGTVPSK